jgi:uncharacterized protein YwgA
LVQEAVIVGLAKRLADRGSWGGETHLQKAAYLLSELHGVDFDFEFILYKHGPYSFELHDELSYMAAEGLIESHVANPRYGPQLRVTERGQELEQDFQKTMKRYEEAVKWVADALGGRGVMDLERLATATWMTRHASTNSVRARADALVEVKPHISLEDAIESVEEIDELMMALEGA